MVELIGVDMNNGGEEIPLGVLYTVYNESSNDEENDSIELFKLQR